MKKRILALLLVGVMLLSTAACGKDSASGAEAQPGGEASVEEVLPDDTTESVEVASTEASVSEEPEPELEEDLHVKDLFAEHGLKAGTCITGSMIDNAKQSQLILDQFSSITMENAMKPDYIFDRQKSVETGDLVVSFNSEVKKVLDWAKENGLAVRGHTLVWYSQTPDWIFNEDFSPNGELVSREVMLARLESYIKQVFEQLTELGYIDMFYAYDVVNEALMEDGSMRDCKWKKIIGDDYIWQAFYFADKYAPESIDLYYNDYNEQFKTVPLKSLVESLVDEEGNYLIDGVGFQAHLYTSDSMSSYFYTVDSIAKMGIKVQLTELDVCLGAYMKQKPADEINLKSQGRFYYELIEGLLKRVDEGSINMDAITFWGFSDALSWRKEYSPMMFDRLYLPKPAFYGTMQIKEKAGYLNQ